MVPINRADMKQLFELFELNVQRFMFLSRKSNGRADGQSNLLL